MSKLIQNYESLAASLGFRLDAARKVIYGKRDEFDFIMYAENTSQYPYMFTVTVGAKSSMGVLDKADIKQFIKSEKTIANVIQDGNVIRMIASSMPKQEKLIENMNININALIAFLKSKGFTPCCQLCGQQEETAGYVTGGSYMHLCPDCAGRLRQDVTLATKQKESKSENVIGGIVGAFLGSVIGIICIIVFSQAGGYVAAASGVVMAICTIKGYELLGGKLTKKGVVVSSIMMLVMTFVGNNLDWAIEIVKVFDGVDIFTAFRAVIPMLQEEIIEPDTFYYNLFLLYALTLVGAVPTVKNALKERKEEGQFAQLGSL